VQVHRVEGRLCREVQNAVQCRAGQFSWQKVTTKGGRYTVWKGDCAEVQGAVQGSSHGTDLGNTAGAAAWGCPVTCRDCGKGTMLLN
jgi:hypothetical protein